jgi:methylglyoxal synthase
MQEADNHVASIGKKKKIALIAHDDRKKDLLQWADFNRLTLSKHILYATGTTGRLLFDELGLKITSFKSGPLGGDEQIGANIVEGNIDFMIFFWDPMSSHPHDPDVKALLRIGVLYNIPMACNRSTADFMISSPLMDKEYGRKMIDYEKRLKRDIPT